MKDVIELEIGPGGTITSLYQPGIEAFADEVGAEIVSMRRLTRVEWEKLDDGRAGWTVRSEYCRLFALRSSDGGPVYPELSDFRDHDPEIAVFKTREEALALEEKYASTFIAFRRLEEEKKRKELAILDGYLRQIEEERKQDPLALVKRLEQEQKP